MQAGGKRKKGRETEKEKGEGEREKVKERDREIKKIICNCEGEGLRPCSFASNNGIEETNNWFRSGEHFDSSYKALFFSTLLLPFLLLLLLWVYVLSEVPLSVICTAVRLRLSICVAFKSNLPEMFTLATFSCFQHSENIYAPTLRSLIPMRIDRLYSGAEL